MYLSSEHQSTGDLGGMRYSQLSLRRTLLGPALSVRLIESQIKGVKKDRDQLYECPFYTGVR